MPIQPSQVITRASSDLSRVGHVYDMRSAPFVDRMVQIVRIADEFRDAVRGSTTDPLRDYQRPPVDDLTRYDEACAQMADPERYNALRALTFEERHECPIGGCRLSAEEHHRLSFGVLSELQALRRRVEELEHGTTPTTEEPA